jgi:hypothetical protein
MTFFENRTVYEIISKNMAETGMPHMKSQHGAYVLHAGSAGLHARTRMHTLTRQGTPCTHTHALTQT